MKIALCFTGHLRTYHQTYESWKKFVIAPYSPDIFIDTWSTLGTFTNKDEMLYLRDANGKRAPISADNPGTLIINSGPLNQDEIRQMYMPLLMNVEEYIEVVNQFISDIEPIVKLRNTPENQESWINFPLAHYSQCYKWWKCNQLKSSVEKQNGFKYDLVIRSRTDLMLTDGTFTGGSMEQVISTALANPNKLYIPQRDDNPNPMWMKDVFFMGSSECIDKLCSIYTKFDEFLLRKHNGEFLGYHDALAHYLVNENVLWEEVPLPIAQWNHCLVR